MQLITNIKDVAEQFLYHWKTFPITLPPPIGLELLHNQSNHRHSSSDPLRNQSINYGGGDNHSAGNIFPQSSVKFFLNLLSLSGSISEIKKNIY